MATAIPLHRRLVGQIAGVVVSISLAVMLVVVASVVIWSLRTTVFAPEAKVIQERMDKAHQEAVKACDDPETKCDERNRGEEIQKFFPAQPKPGELLEIVPIRRK